MATHRYAVLSDMHFGTPESNVNHQASRSGLLVYLADRAPWKEIVLTGDLLDANLSTFKRAIEGGRYDDLKPALYGFRAFLADLDRLMKERHRSGLAALAEAWVYTPGNHDYKVWDILSTHVAFEDVLQSGKPLSSFPGPLQSRRWAGAQSFFGGLFQPFGAQDQVAVEYPDHVVELSADGKGGPETRMLFTHGHYLDKSQTLWTDIQAHLGGDPAPADLPEAVRTLFIKTAQYQAVASAVSFTQSTRHLVDGAVGPEGWGSKFGRFLTWLRSAPLRWFFGHERRRGEGLSEAHLQRIETYLTRFRGHQDPPRWFLFGHTHCQGQGTTRKLGIKAFNAGSCYPEGAKLITFAEIEADAAGAPRVYLRSVDERGGVR